MRYFNVLNGTALLLFFQKQKKAEITKSSGSTIEEGQILWVCPVRTTLTGSRIQHRSCVVSVVSLGTIHFLFYKSHSAASASTEAAQCVCPACPCRSMTDLTLHGVGGMIEVLWNFAALCLNRPIKTLPSARARSSVMSLLALSWPRFVETWPANTKALALKTSPDTAHPDADACRKYLSLPQYVKLRLAVRLFPSLPHWPACWMFAEATSLSYLTVSSPCSCKSDR